MKLRNLTVAALAMAALGFGLTAPASARIEVGVLNCTVEGGAGFIIGSTKQMVCDFRSGDRVERYRGTINKFGLDIGITGRTFIAWAVFAPGADVAHGALEGTYVGVSGEATAGAGVGANALIGGFQKSITLQPLSVQAQTGVNIALGIASLRLDSVN